MLVRFGSVWFGLVRWGLAAKKKAKQISNACGAHQHMLLLKQRRLLVRRGSAWFGVVRRPKKGQKIKNVRGVFFVVGSAGFGRVRRGLVGLPVKTQGGRVAKKRRPPQVVQW